MVGCSCRVLFSQSPPRFRKSLFLDVVGLSVPVGIGAAFTRKRKDKHIIVFCFWFWRIGCFCWVLVWLVVHFVARAVDCLQCWLDVFACLLGWGLWRLPFSLFLDVRWLSFLCFLSWSTVFHVLEVLLSPFSSLKPLPSLSLYLWTRLDSFACFGGYIDIALYLL